MIEAHYAWWLVYEETNIRVKVELGTNQREKSVP